ncbi:MAG: hypothetical protein U9Q82_06800, partial [Chloroflexota bacterium]|nr:hypothetical protein [Chloroflexota bacterium]
QFFRNTNIDHDKYVAYIEKQLLKWNLSYALEVGLATPDNLPDDYHCDGCTNFDDRILIIKNNHVLCSCGYDFGSFHNSPKAEYT